MVTGVSRYNAIETALAGTREPKWTDFIDGDGNLLSVDFLASESSVARTARTRAIDREIDRQRKALLDVQRQGFESPNVAPRLPLVVPPSASDLQPTKARIDRRSPIANEKTQWPTMLLAWLVSVLLRTCDDN